MSVTLSVRDFDEKTRQDKQTKLSILKRWSVSLVLGNIFTYFIRVGIVSNMKGLCYIIIITLTFYTPLQITTQQFVN